MLRRLRPALAVVAFFAVTGGASVAILAAYGAFAPRPPIAAPRQPSPAAVAVRPAGASRRRVEIAGFVESTGETNGVACIVVAARQPMPLGTTYTSIRDYDRALTRAMLTPRVQCFFDRPLTVAPLSGQRIRIRGVTADPGEPERLDRCEVMEYPVR